VTNPAAEANDRTGATRILMLVLVGAVGGLFSGAFGVGGGIVMVPLFVWLLRFDQRRASATSLVAIVPASLVGATIYFANGHVDVVAALSIGAGGVLGALIGTRLLRVLPLTVLRWAFVVLLVAAAVRLLFEVPSRGAALELGVWAIVGFVLFGVAVGTLSGLLGVGGGVIIVPVLIGVLGVSDLLAKGTSLLAMVPISTVGTIANLRARLVRLSDGVIAGVFAVAASFGGSAIAFLMPPRLSATLFAILLLLTALQLAWRAIRLQRRARD
jgi:uncharacterized protein